MRKRKNSFLPEKRTCKFCGNIFQPASRAFRQTVCFKVSCQKARKKATFYNWKMKNIEYYKLKDLSNESKKTEIKRVNEWKKKNKKEYNRYMKNLMREKRNKNNA